ncbi:MAG TPA: hypothetical protein VK674_01235 [Candidatus Limnocylindria bacterium]|nr:hypothetical protein [Candidatus Limnocylindria bacterium]
MDRFKPTDKLTYGIVPLVVASWILSACGSEDDPSAGADTSPVDAIEDIAYESKVVASDEGDGVTVYVYRNGYEPTEMVTASLAIEYACVEGSVAQQGEPD